MIKQFIAIALLMLSVPHAFAQSDSLQDALEDALEEALEEVEEDTAEGVTRENVAQGTGAILRGLDKVDGQILDMTLPNGMIAEIGRLSVELIECRYPAEEGVSDAYALMNIRDITSSEILFSGWMLASSPALNSLEHPRYDVWVLRCKTE